MAKENQNADFNSFTQMVYINKNFSRKKICQILKIKSSAIENCLLSHEYIVENVNNKVLEMLSESANDKFPVDLLYFNNINDTLTSVNSFEIKMGGNLDTKNADSNAKEVKRLFDCFSFISQNDAYFATCYGICSDAVKTKIKKETGKEAILNGVDFWEMILPVDRLTYADFIIIFKRAWKDSGIEKQLEEL